MSVTPFRFCPLCRTALVKHPVEGLERQVCPDCGWIRYLNPIPCSAALVRNDQGGILLVKRGAEPGKGLWGLPSGFIEQEETPESACLRELEEETGLEGEIKSMIGVYTQESARYKRVIIIGYAVKAWGTLRPGSDSVEARFFPPDRMPRLAFESHGRIIRDSLDGGGG